MTREQLEHVIRAAGAIAEVDRIVIVGSQAILGFDPDPAPELLVSMEADVYPPDHTDRADLIDGSIGEGSMFHETFGYYAHGIGPETATLPAGWEARLVEVRNERTNQVAGLCLHPVDLAVSKLAAGRDKDLRYVRVLLATGLVTIEGIRDAVGQLDAQVARRIAPILPRLA